MEVIEVRGNDVHFLTIEERDGIEHVVSNDKAEGWAAYAQLLADFIGIKTIRYVNPGNDGSPIAWANDGIG